MQENLQLYDLVMKDQEYIIYFKDQPLQTKGGSSYSHPGDRLMRHLLTELQSGKKAESNEITALLLFEAGKDLREEEVRKEIVDAAKTDPFILLKTSGERKPSGAENISGEADPLYFDLLYWSLSSILKNLNQFIEENISSTELPDENEDPFILLLKQQFAALAAEKKAAIHLLSNLHGSGIVLPLLFVNGKVTISEYAKAVIALRYKKGERDRTTDGEKLKIFRDGATVSDFLSYFSLPSSTGKQVRDIIAEGESDHTEFKSTLRWDLRANKTNPAIERASLKTICAFLNSAGGQLIIGVRDDGSIEGIESDKLPNEDRFLLHLWTLIRTCFGKDVSPYVRTNLEKVSDKTICIVNCAPSQRPVFLRQPGFDEEFYIRLGPSSAALDISEALKYIADRYAQN